MPGIESMIIPILHRRPASRYRALFISLIVTFILSMCLLTSSEFMTAIGYKRAESIALFIVMLHILLLFVFLFSKTMVVTGNLYLLDNGFEIKMHSGSSKFFLKSMVRFKLVIEGYKGQNHGKVKGHRNDGSGNFLVIQTMESTVFYELMLNSKPEMISMLDYFRNNEYPGIIAIEFNSKDS